MQIEETKKSTEDIFKTQVKKSKMKNAYFFNNYTYSFNSAKLSSRKKVETKTRNDYI